MCSTHSRAEENRLGLTIDNTLLHVYGTDSATTTLFMLLALAIVSKSFFYSERRIQKPLSLVTIKETGTKRAVSETE